MSDSVLIKKKKKDFKLREDIVIEFEKLAPSGKQTLIVENLIGQWVANQKRQKTLQQVQTAYQKEQVKLKKAAK